MPNLQRILLKIISAVVCASQLRIGKASGHKEVLSQQRRRYLFPFSSGGSGPSTSVTHMSKGAKTGSFKGGLRETHGSFGHLAQSACGNSRVWQYMRWPSIFFSHRFIQFLKPWMRKVVEQTFPSIFFANTTVVTAVRDFTFYARQHICYSAYMLWQFHLSICPSHGWISQKRLKLGLCSFHRTVAPSL